MDADSFCITDPIRMSSKEWKKNTIRNMQRSRSSTLTLLKSLPAKQILKSGTQGKWSIKDVFAHIVAWEEEACKRLDLILKGKSSRLYFYEDMSVAHRFNARAVARFKTVSMNKLIETAERIRNELLHKFRELPVEEINNTTHKYPVAVWLPELGYEHESEHRKKIRDQRSETNRKRTKSKS